MTLFGLFLSYLTIVYMESLAEIALTYIVADFFFTVYSVWKEM